MDGQAEIAIYELLDVAERGAMPPAWVALYDSGLAAYRTRNFTGAISPFSASSGSAAVRPTRAHYGRTMQPISQIAARRGLGSDERNESQ